MEMCSESGYGVVDGVGGCTEYLRDRVGVGVGEGG